MASVRASTRRIDDPNNGTRETLIEELRTRLPRRTRRGGPRAAA
eukprot:CAMPEP_0185710476 /NCGR_PEP_ID=MMETSP1164-20130828/30832_1 /TAXON_ID=1104430 /ORGANISM="Chrysoreinhardia sp, Strain CCMP2950" /LENGTH=43 /DNA_ID= /DNA_START= /DNA_END= /DNA_ORIENTATION=